MAFVMMIETVSQVHTVTQNVMSSLYSNWKYMALAFIVIAIVTVFMIYNAFTLEPVESPNEVVVEGFNFPERPPPPPPVGDEPADAGNDNQQVINGGESPDKHNNNENDNNSKVHHSSTIVHEYIENNRAPNNRGFEDGNEIGQNKKPENVTDTVPQVDNLQSVRDHNVSQNNNSDTDPVLLDDSHTEDEEYTQKPQEQDETVLPEHIAQFPNTDTCSTITNPSSVSDEADIELANIKLSQNLLKNEMESEEVFDLNTFTTSRIIGRDIADRIEAEIIPEDDTVKKDQATPLEKESPEILASILTRQEEHEYMTTAIEVTETNTVKPSWVVKCLFPGYYVKDFPLDSFDVKKQ